MVIVDLFTRQAADPLTQSIPQALGASARVGTSTPRSTETETGLYHYEWYVEVV